MPSPTIVEGDVIFNGTVSIVSGLSPPDGTIKNQHVSSAAADVLGSSKLVHRFSESRELFAPTVTVTALTQLLRGCRKGGTIVGIEGLVITPATGADRTISVDLQKSTAGGAYATVLSTTVDFDNTSVARTLVSGVVSVPAFIDGDSFQLVVTVAGVAGAQAAGLLVSVDIDQNPVT